MRQPDWQLLYFGREYRKWTNNYGPSSNLSAAVRRWARELTRHGPSSMAIPVSPSGQDFTELVPESDAVVVYVLDDYEDLVIMLEIY